ncbi:MAG: ADP-ribosylglycohydrolase family protein [Pseudomonadota bacterium]
MASETSIIDRAFGALAGMAIGDALGMPSQTLTRQQIHQHYGQITGFVVPFDDHPVSHGLRAGQITDDTEQALMLAQRLIAGRGRINEAQLASDLLAWEADVKARGFRDLLGPSSRAALDAMLAGAPISQTGRGGTTNGAAMRIAPIGIATPIEPLAGFVDQVELACRMTHNTGEAIAGAAAVAAIISCGLEGRDFDKSVRTAVLAAKEGQKRGYAAGDGDMAARVRDALSLARRVKDINELVGVTGTSVASHQSIPAAFGIVSLADGNPWKAALIAANVGDDTDTIGAMAGAMAGACSGSAALPKAAVEFVLTANALPLQETARRLLKLRKDVTARAGLQDVKS